MYKPVVRHTNKVLVEYIRPEPRKRFVLEIRNTDSLRVLKDKIANEMHIPLGSFRILSNGDAVTAPDATPLYECLAYKDDGYTVIVIGNPDSSGGEPSHVYERELVVNVFYDGRRLPRTNIAIPVLHTTRLQALKETIATRLGIPTNTFKLESNGRNVTGSDETPLNECLTFRGNEYSVYVIDVDPEAERAHERAWALHAIEVASAEVTRCEGILREAIEELARIDVRHRST